MEVERKRIVDLFSNGSSRYDVLQELKKENRNICEASAISKIKIVELQFKVRWAKSKRARLRFLKDNKKWLQQILVFAVQAKPSGRHSKGFSECGLRTKKKKIQQIKANYSTEELIFAAASSATSAGCRLTGKSIQHISKGCVASTSLAERKSADSLTAEEAVGFLCRNGFSKAQYNDIRKTTLERGIDIYPAYNHLVIAKNLCYPLGLDNILTILICYLIYHQFTGISVSPSEANVALQHLFDHTIRRLFAYLAYDSFDSKGKYTIIFKWGCDGSSNHARYV